MINSLSVKSFGPITEGEFNFGALNVFIGPQASGKSLVLQLIKLLLDTGAIQETLGKYGIVWRDAREFVERVFGEGMRAIWSDETEVAYTLEGKPSQRVVLARLARKGNRSTEESVFYIPAHRALAINPQSGWFRGFFDYRVGDPFVLRDFSEKLRVLGDQEAEGASNESAEELPNVKTKVLFPQKKRLKQESREALADAVFGGYSLAIEVSGGQRRLMLHREGSPSLPFTTWSAGQREFVPLLLGTYYLLPGAATSQRGNFRVAIIEEIEMGLHPRGIAAAMLLVLDLLQRGYQTFLSTHSARVLDYVWALLQLRDLNAAPELVLKLFELPKSPQTQALARAALDREKPLHTYYFDRRKGRVLDISSLDPADEREVVAEWGGLVGATGQIGDLIAEAFGATGQSSPALEG